MQDVSWPDVTVGFDILLILVTSSKNRTKEESQEELVRNRTKYQKQNPNWKIKAQEFCDHHGFDIDGNNLQGIAPVAGNQAKNGNL